MGDLGTLGLYDFVAHLDKSSASCLFFGCKPRCAALEEKGLVPERQIPFTAEGRGGGCRGTIAGASVGV